MANKKRFEDRTRGLLTRRQFVGSTAGLGLGTVAMGALPRFGRANAPRFGGHLRIGIGGGSMANSLDPATYADDEMTLLGYAMRGCLVEVAPDGSAVPEIAESFEGSDAGKKWIFRLRKNLEFSDGRRVTTDDIIQSINHHRHKDSKSGAKPLLGPIVDIRADGSETIVFTLQSGNADFPFIVADYHLNIMPFKDGSPDLQVGAGPYKLAEFDPGVRSFFERNENSHKRGYMDSAEIIIIHDSTARQTALLTDDIDVISPLDLKTANLLAENDRVKVGSYPGRSYSHFTCNTQVDPYSDADVRLALKYAIDREKIVRTILAGHGQLGNDQPITPDYRFFAKDLKPRPYDPDRARFHLKKAGLDSLEVELHAADVFAGAIDASVLYAEQAQAAGIKIRVSRVPQDGYWSDVWMQKPFIASNWAGRATEDAILTLQFSKESNWNDTYWDNQRFNELLVKARSELNDDKRRPMYEEMQRIINDDGGIVAPMFENLVHATSARVGHHDKLAGDRELDGARCIERWWLQ